jgi:dTDP-4-dehydrorhamnose 3,5-epimerase
MIIKTKFKGLLLIKNKKFLDTRGYFQEICRENNIKKKFPFVVMSYSKKNVLRGLHIQIKKSQGKFITVLKGKIFDVSLDLRKNSRTYGKYFTCILSEKNNKSIYVPEGFAHGFLSLDKENYVVYSCTKYRDAKSEKAINYKDKSLNIKWPIKRNKILISNKDLFAPSFKDFEKLHAK